jgi:hypothetical protein
VSEEQGERFRHDIKEMERRDKGQWNVNMMGDYSWTLHCEILETSHNRKSNVHSLMAREKDSKRPLNKI